MKILLTAKFLSGSAKEGGSSRFFDCVHKQLLNMGHEIVLSVQPFELVNEKFDLIICSHNEILREARHNPSPKVCISQGIIGDEHMGFGADRYISISPEIKAVNKARGFDSDIVLQPIDMPNEYNKPNERLEKILIIRRHPIIGKDPFAFLFDEYNVRISDINVPIEDQIQWADLCITLGRGALESMAYGRPVIVADSRPYNYDLTGQMAIGDGYVTPVLIEEIAKNNFSGRRFAIPITKDWLEAEIKKYNSEHGEFLHDYVKVNHEASMIVAEYLKPVNQNYSGKICFGVMINDEMRFDSILKRSAINGEIEAVHNPERATTALNSLLDTIESNGYDVAVLTHQDMHYREGWIDQLRSQLKLLPDNWILAGIIGKDAYGRICGRFRDMRFTGYFDTSEIHSFPHPVCCFDEACIIVNLKSGFRFDESFEGFDLYGTLCVLQAWEMNGNAWVIDAPAEHYCMRPFSWCPDELFKSNYKKLWDRFEGRIDSTAIGRDRDARDERSFMVSAN